ncbi:MAG: hypothetical protein OHK0057_37490 [Thermoflexibacter sp.]
MADANFKNTAKKQNPMTFLHSFWTTTTDILALKGGFPHAKFHLMSWALSSLQVRKFYDKLTLYTDNFGKELLVERLGLPYTAVYLDLQDLAFDLPKSLWTPKKMYAYSLQTEPFLHIDGDVFIWKPFEENLLSTPLVAQNLDVNMDFYREVLQTVFVEFSYVPAYLDRDLSKDLIAANAGVIGGTNFLFFKAYVQEVYQFLDRNRAHLGKVNLDYLSTFTEQYLYHAFAKHKGMEIAQVVQENVSPTYFPELFRFTDLPNRCSYIHLMNGKAFPTFCENMAQRLHIDYPEMYQKVLDTIKDLTPKTSIIVDKSIKNEDLFYRTKFVLESWVGLEVAQENGESLMDFIDRIDALIEELPESTAKNLIQEVASFEFEKYDFLISLPPTEELKTYFKAESIKANQAMSLPLEVLLSQEITLSPFAKFIETEWNWVEANEFAMQKHGIDYLSNLKKESAYYKVALIICIEQDIVREQLLDMVNILLFETLEGRQKIETVIKNVFNQITNHLSDKTEAEINQILLGKISYFLYHHILQLI